MKIAYEAHLIRETKNYWVYSYATGSESGFQFYVLKTDVAQPPKAARLTLEAA